MFNPLQAKVLLYLLAVEPAMNGMFKLLNEPVLTVDQLRQRARNKENSILELQSQLANSNLAQDRDTAELLEQLVRDALLDRSRAAIEESIRSGNEGKALVDSSVSAGIILLAHRCIELAGAALKNGGRQIVRGYVLKDFLHHARNHAVHFFDPKPHTALETFQKTVLNYDPSPIGPFQNCSAKCLSLLGWKSWNDVHNDIRSLLL
jgi:hypothetical protein